MSAIDNLPTFVCSDAARLGMRSQDQPLDTVKVADQQISVAQTGGDYKTSATAVAVAFLII